MNWPPGRLSWPVWRGRSTASKALQISEWFCDEDLLYKHFYEFDWRSDLWMKTCRHPLHVGRDDSYSLGFRLLYCYLAQFGLCCPTGMSSPKGDVWCLSECLCLPCRYRNLKQQLDLKTEEAQILETKLQQSSFHQQQEELEALQKTIGTLHYILQILYTTLHTLYYMHYILFTTLLTTLHSTTLHCTLQSTCYTTPKTTLTLLYTTLRTSSPAVAKLSLTSCSRSGLHMREAEHSEWLFVWPSLKSLAIQKIILVIFTWLTL